MRFWVSTLVLILFVIVGCGEGPLRRAYDRDGDGFDAVQLDGDDCDDSNPLVNPSAPEVCGDGVDNDCDGLVDDDGFGNVTWYVDQDGDGFPSSEPHTACVVPDGAFDDLDAGVDCNDLDSGANPGMEERCGDGVDNDCDGEIDEEDVDFEVWYVDRDGDGYPGLALIQGCEAPEGSFPDLSVGVDCNDDDTAVNPSVDEVCGDGIDNDCDGRVDDDGVGAVTWYPDEDGDGYGVDNPRTSCVAPSDSVPSLAAGIDCDDGDASAHPGADEIWYDGRDQDCMGGDDYDRDGDSWRSSVHGGEDCDDEDPLINPSVEEVCNNGVDDNCRDDDVECEWPVAGTLESVSAVAYATGESVSGGIDDVAVGRYFGDVRLDIAVLVGNEDVYIIPGGTLAGIISERSVAAVSGGGRSFGVWNISGISDHDGDGYDDLLIPVPNSASVRIWSGPVRDQVLDVADLPIFASAELGMRFGSAVMGGRWVTSRRHDVLIADAGLSFQNPEPKALFFSRVLSPPHEWDQTIADVGVPFADNVLFDVADLNADGLDDLLVVGYRYSNGTNVVSVVYGPVQPGGSAASSPRITGPAEQPGFACDIAAGDVRGGGVDELIVADDGGAIRIYEAPSTGIVGWMDFSTAISWDWSGSCPDLQTGDFNGDGVDDLLVATSDSLSGSIRVLVYSGPIFDADQPTKILSSNAARTSRRNTFEVADFNDDGIDDVVVATDSSIYVLYGSGQ